MVASPRTSGPWDVQRFRGDAAVFHARDAGDSGHREIWVFDVVRPALVLGSTQPADDVERGAAERLGVEVVRRRSGGGAVLLDPGASVWVDAVVPRGDELWHDDVGRAFDWFGRVWAAALADLGVPSHALAVHEGALVTSALSPTLCFAGLGPGEVTVDRGKAVGISQRRTRSAIRLQSSLLLGWDVDRHAALLAPGLVRVRPGAEPRDSLAEVVVSPQGGFAATAVLEALVARLPAG